MSQRTGTRRRTWKERALSLLLAAALAAGLAPGLTLPASAEHWADAYLDQLVDWGVLRSDQTGNPDADITRAEFAAVINRAYGYTETGPIPFTDVLLTDWFYDDVSIAYTAGYMAGTSATTASPNDTLTREQAVCILGRNMMMKETPGESLAFTDSRDVSDWARGTVKTAVDNYIISGYPDNTFQPQSSISMGQVAVLLTQCVGNPIQQSGTYEMGGVFGNVTITAPNVTLYNTVISGDLYVSGGVGLGGIKLENVDVLGRIIVSGTGESEGGSASVIMRNVTANEMLVDNMRGKTVTVRADGITDIAKTVVRTNAYLEDNNTDDKGLMNIDLDGDSGIRLTLAGRIKEVMNKTPSSYIQVAKGTVAKITVDEAAPYSSVQIDRNTRVNELNLDVAASVLGDGDIGQLNINAPGSVVSMLPDNIYIRPGLTASIAGVIMDYLAAEEGSLDPRLLSGYPAAKDISPTGFRADFASNKKGTVYWAVSYVSDGSIGEEALISPPSYGSKAVTNGSLAAPAGGDEVSTQVSKLVVGGSYYLSALVVDELNNRSPVKVVSFSTPDNTVPAFAQGYPYMSRTTREVAQITVMPTKSCKLYYALLPKGAQAPTVNDLKAAAVTGNLGYGVRDVTKNTEDVFTVNSGQLEELKEYVLYLWLTDVDGANSSNISSLTFKTPDDTPPRFNPEAGLSGNPGATNVPLVVGLDEPGTVYWVAVLRGATYPLPNNQNMDDNVQDAAGVWTADLTKDYAKLQVKNGRNGVRSGSVRITAADTDTTMNITGLARETAYDLYYVAMDASGNYSAEVKKLAINTLDETPPTVKQYFNRYTGKDNTRDPLVTTDIMLEFSEDFRSATGTGKSILDIWARMSSLDAIAKREAEGEFYDLLSRSIELYQMSTSNIPDKVDLWDGNGEEPPSPWINFHKAIVTTRDGRVIVTLPYDEDDDSQSAHKLNSGSTYYFQIRNITDNSDKQNAISPNPVNYENMGTTHNVPVFTTVFAQVHLSTGLVAADRPSIRTSSPDTNGAAGTGDFQKGNAEVDYTFRMIPDATQTVDKGYSYDLQLYTGSNLAFDLYCRISNNDGEYLKTAEAAAGAGITSLPSGTGADNNNWFYLGNSGPIIQKPEASAGLRGVSVNGKNMANLLNFPTVSSLQQGFVYDFVITVTEQGGEPERGVWTGKVEFEIHVLAGQSHILQNLANDAYQAEREYRTSLPLTQEGLASIGQTQSGDKFLTVEKTFIDSRIPRFDQGFPKITPGDSFADITINLDRAGTVYYVAIPVDSINTRATFVKSTDSAANTGDLSSTYTDYSGENLWYLLPDKGQNVSNQGTLLEKYQYASSSGTDSGAVYDITINTPNAQQLMTQTAYNAYEHGVRPYDGGGATLTIPLRGLTAQQKYIVFFVLKGVADTPSQVFAYRFETNESSKPRIALTDGNGRVRINTSYGSSDIYSVPSSLVWIVLPQREGQTALDDAGIGDIRIAEGITSYGRAPAANDEDRRYIVTLLDALSSSYDNKRAGVADGHPLYGSDKNGYSLFDLFASDEQKRTLDSLIRDPATLPVISSDTRAVTTAASNYQTYANWQASSIYADNPPDASARFLILVIGHNSASSTGTNDWSPVDSFRSLSNIKVTDTVAPKLKVSNRGEVLGTGVDGSITHNNNNDTFSGYIYLNFDKNLYWARSEEDDTLYAVTSGGAEPSDTTGQVGILYEMLSSWTVADNVTFTASGGGDTFMINFSNVKNLPATVTLLSKGFINNGSGTSTSNRIIITLNQRPNDSQMEGVFMPYITVTYGEQSATVDGTQYGGPYDY